MSANEYGLDVHYFRKNLERILRDIDRYKPEEMKTALTRLASVCNPENTCPYCEGHKTRIHGADENWCDDCEKSYCVC